MPYINVKLDNGKGWGITNCELVLPVSSLEGMGAEEIGRKVLALAPYADEFQGYLRSSSSQNYFDSFDEFLEALEIWKRKEEEKRQRKERRKQVESTNSRKDNKPNAMRAYIWSKTEGRCYYCGLFLEHKTTFCIDHVIPQIKGGGDEFENVVPACRSCNSTKGTKQIEEFRFHKRMQKYEKQNGVWFTLQQVGYLRDVGVELDIPPHLFWFEDEGNAGCQSAV